MKGNDLEKLRIPDAQRSGRGLPAPLIFGGVALVLAVAVFFAWPRKSDAQRIATNTATYKAATAATPPSAAAPIATPAATKDAVPGDILLTTSGYIINRERIELSPRFVGTVKWMGVKKGDVVKKGQTIVLLEDSEQRAHYLQAEGQLARAKSALAIATSRHERFKKLREQRVESEQQMDDAEAELAAAQAGVREAQGLLDYARSQLEWTIIRSPIDGVVLEKLADENELVSPQSFGGDNGPSTALVAVANPQDLQVEIDLNEADLAKISMGQPCRVTPEAYTDHHYEGFVAEIAPEANRQKGTLQVKVQIRNPDRFLVPELSAKVDFLGETPTGAR